MSNIYRNTLKCLILVCLVITLQSCESGLYGSDVGDQGNDPPVAVATVLGVGAPGSDGAFIVRAGSEIVLSAKDSDGVDEPLQSFGWAQTDGSGFQVVLFERSNDSRAFTVPDVPTETTLQFQLTVTDASNESATDSVTLSVMPVADTNVFLLEPTVDENYYLFVSPPPGEELTTDQAFTVTATPIAYWTDRSGTAQVQSLDVETVTGVLMAGFTGPADVVDEANRYFKLPIPLLDADEINKFFQGAGRNSRLEPELAEGARLEIRIELVPASPGNYGVYLARVGEQSSFEMIAASTVAGLEQEISMLPIDGAVVSNSGTLTADLSEELIRQFSGFESKLTASNYYDCIDPLRQATTLSDWLQFAGFTGGSGTQAGDVAHAVYVNNYDLGFGRDMFLRQDDEGNVFSYVVNYPTLEATVNKQGEFATVVMEFSDAPTGQCGDGTFSTDEKIVKFYAYVPDEGTGDMVRATSMNFDGRGERMLPGVCLACHDGVANRANSFSASTLGDIPAAAADMDASFMPWDVDSFLFTSASDPASVDPTYTSSEFSDEQTQMFSRESQEAELRALNQGALSTYVYDPADRKRFEEPIRLIHGWYGNSGALPQQLESADDRNDVSVPSPLLDVDESVLVELPDNAFDGSYIQPEWAAQPDLYYDVFARNCRLCHAQQGNLELNFESYDEFINTFSNGAVESVFRTGRMPLARLTMDRFWAGFGGDEESAAELLRGHLAALPEPIIVEGLPGDPVPEFLIPNLLNSKGETIDLDASASSFVDSYLWTVINSCGNAPIIEGAAEPVASFLANESPCSYEVTLSATNDRKMVNRVETLNTDLIPATVDFSAPLTGYTPGESALIIGVVSEIMDVGDGDLIVVVNNSEMPYDLADNPNVTNNSDGTVTMQFPALAGTSDSFEYQIEDLNGTLSEVKGEVDVVIAPIVPSMGGARVVAMTSAELSWSVPPEFVADSYNIYRDDVEIDSVLGAESEPGQPTEFLFLDPGLALDTEYVYEVTAILGAEESARSDQAGVVTVSDTPENLELVSRTTTSINIAWSPAENSNPDSYNVYRDNVSIATGVTDTMYLDGSLIANTNYTYQISAVEGNAESFRSASFTRATETAAPTLNAPVEADSTTTSISLSWVDGINGGTPSYQVYRDGDADGIATNDTSTTITGLPSNTSFSFTVKATGSAGGISEPSNQESGATLVSFSSDIYDEMVSINDRLVADPNRSDCASSGCHVGVNSSGGFSMEGVVRDALGGLPAGGNSDDCIANPVSLFCELMEDINEDPAYKRRINLTGVDDPLTPDTDEGSSRMIACPNEGCEGTIDPLDEMAQIGLTDSETNIILKWIAQGAHF